jgi:hypothetical protein
VRTASIARGAPVAGIAFLRVFCLPGLAALFIHGAGCDLFCAAGLPAFLVRLLDVFVLPLPLRALDSSWRHVLLLNKLAVKEMSANNLKLLGEPSQCATLP